MASCKCGRPMVIEGTRLICKFCGRSYEVPVKPSYEELEYLLKKQNEYIARLEEQLESLEAERGISFH